MIFYLPFLYIATLYHLHYCNWIPVPTFTSSYCRPRCAIVVTLLSLSSKIFLFLYLLIAALITHLCCRSLHPTLWLRVELLVNCSSKTMSLPPLVVTFFTIPPLGLYVAFHIKARFASPHKSVKRRRHRGTIIIIVIHRRTKSSDIDFQQLLSCAARVHSVPKNILIRCYCHFFSSVSLFLYLCCFHSFCTSLNHWTLYRTVIPPSRYRRSPRQSLTFGPPPVMLSSCIFIYAEINSIKVNSHFRLPNGAFSS